MGSVRDSRLPAGRQPYDGLNGLRIGALAGGLLGVVAAAVTGVGGIWLVAGTAVVAGAAGYGYEKHRRIG
jgi:hypothetical protein